MRTNPFQFKKCSWLPATFFIIISLGVISSCNNEKKEKKMMPLIKGSGINASCFELPKSQIQSAWADPGYLGKINYVVFYTSLDPATQTLSVQALAFDNNNSSLGSPITLTKGKNCSLRLPSLAIGENIISMSELGIVNAGQLTAFDYILLTPKKFTPTPPTPVDGDYLSYDAEVKGGSIPSESRPTLPCPPCQYCKPQSCDTVILNDTIPAPQPTTGQ
jgi:hypothetical protein